MIITRTPFRVSLFGGGSDYPKWFSQHGGAVVGFAIDKYCYVSLRELPPFFEHRHRIVYSKIETVTDLTEIQHPSARHVLLECGVNYGVELHHDGDLPARSGLGSSSAFTVGLLHAVQAQAGRMVSKDYLAQEAIRIEQQVIKESVGVQDQIWAAYGGMNRINFQVDGTYSVQPLIMHGSRRHELVSHLMMFFTGLQRFAHDIASKKIADLDKRAANVHAMVGMVDEAEQILVNPNGDLNDIGRMLDESWRLKRGLSDGITNAKIDEIYDAGMRAGARGGKLLGAGGGGFLILFVEPHRQQEVRERLSSLIEVDINVDHVGSRVVVYEPREFGLKSIGQVEIEGDRSGAA